MFRLTGLAVLLLDRALVPTQILSLLCAVRMPFCLALMSDALRDAHSSGRWAEASGTRSST